MTSPEEPQRHEHERREDGTPSQDAAPTRRRDGAQRGRRPALRRLPRCPLPWVRCCLALSRLPGRLRLDLHFLRVELTSFLVDVDDFVVVATLFLPPPPLLARRHSPASVLLASSASSHSASSMNAVPGIGLNRYGAISRNPLKHT